MPTMPPDRAVPHETGHDRAGHTLPARPATWNGIDGVELLFESHGLTIAVWLDDPALIADQRALRRYLMEACVQARRHLGLEPLTLDAVTAEPPEEPVPGTA